MCQIDTKGAQIWGQRFKLPDRMHTVPREELYVLQYLAGQAHHHSHLKLVTDSKVSADLFNKGKARATASSHFDLFKFIFQDISLKSFTLEVIWMPSHMQRDLLDKNLPLPEGSSVADVKANDHADVLAGDAAKSQEVMPQ